MLQGSARAAVAICVKTNKKWRLLEAVHWPGKKSFETCDWGFSGAHLDSQVGGLLLLQTLVLQLAGDVLEAHLEPSL